MTATERRTLSMGVWLLIMLAIIMGQYIITGWVGGYGGDKEVLSHISLAGTVVSIILAILAIVYTYFQTFSQQRDSATIASQIDSLRRVLEEIRSSRADLSDQVQRLEDLGQKVDRSVSVAEQSHRSVQELAIKFEQIKLDTASTSNRSTSAATTVPKEALATRLIEGATYLQLVLYQALRLGIEKRLPVREIATRIVAAAVLGQTGEWGKSWTDGIFTGQWQMLVDCDLLKITQSNVHDLNAAFVRRLDARFQAMPDPTANPLITVDSLKAAAAAVSAPESDAVA